MTSSNSNLPQYLLDCFERIARSEGFAEYTIELDDSSTHGQGIIAAIMRLTLVGRREVRPNVVQFDQLPLVCKLLPENEKRRQYFSTVKLFQREAYFYNTVLPELMRLQQDKGLNETNGFYALPKCYAAIADAENDQFYIVMGDLKVQKYELWNQEVPISVEAVRLLMVALGRLHALSFALRDQQPEVLAQFENMDDSWLAMTEQTVYQKFIAKSYRLSLETLVDEKHLKVIRRMKTKWLQWWHQCLGTGVAGRFAVIGQGDCWNNNMLFRFEEIESLDDFAGRLLVKLALGGAKEWFNEFMVQPVSKQEYTKYAKVINSAKYEEYKLRQEAKIQRDNIKKEKDDITFSMIGGRASSGNKDQPPTNDDNVHNIHDSDSETSDDQRKTPKRSESRRSQSLDRLKRYETASVDNRTKPCSDDDERRSRRDANGSESHRNDIENRSKSRRDDDEHQRSTFNRYGAEDRPSKTHSSRLRHASNSRKPSNRLHRNSSSDNSDAPQKSSSSRHKSSKKKKSHTKKSKSRRASRSRSSQSSDDDRHHKKKTKKSKRSRSRSGHRR